MQSVIMGIMSNATIIEYYPNQRVSKMITYLLI